jgi:integrase/recombinase XerD
MLADVTMCPIIVAWMPTRNCRSMRRVRVRGVFTPKMGCGFRHASSPGRSGPEGLERPAFFRTRRWEMAKAFLESDDVAKMEMAARCLRDRLPIKLSYRLGSRVSEVISTAVPDIDLVHGTVTIEHLKTRLHSTCPKCSARLGRRHTYCPKCGEEVARAVALAKQHRRMRVLPIDEDTIQMVKEYIVSGGPVERGGRLLLFGISRHRAWQIVRDCARRAGLPDLVNPETGRTRGVSPHRLRDAFAVHAMRTDDSGEGMRLLQEHLGHQSFNTTARYRKVSGEEHRSWYDRLWRK